jgi:citrate lyase subunit beta / citryl-CoA lyase
VTQLVTPRSWLFCPADRPDRLGKAVTLADAAVADLEDAVPPQAKVAAREALTGWLSGHPEEARRTWVRVNNAPGLLDADLDAVGTLGIAGIVVPKAEPEILAAVRGRSPARLVALVETAAALWQVREIAAAGGMYTIGLGEYDLAADLGAASPDEDAQPLGWARTQVVAAAAAAGLAPPPAPVSARFDDPAGFAETTRALLRAGFFGRMCIHPRQVELTHEAVRPTSQEVREAREVVGAAETAERDGTGVVVVSGRMVDIAVVRRARRVLALAERDETPSQRGV